MNGIGERSYEPITPPTSTASRRWPPLTARRASPSSALEGLRRSHHLRRPPCNPGAAAVISRPAGRSSFRMQASVGESRRQTPLRTTRERARTAQRTAAFAWKRKHLSWATRVVGSVRRPAGAEPTSPPPIWTSFLKPALRSGFRSRRTAAAFREAPAGAPRSEALESAPSVGEGAVATCRSCSSSKAST
jgi:hypothetical protein